MFGKVTRKKVFQAGRAGEDRGFLLLRAGPASADIRARPRTETSRKWRQRKCGDREQSHGHYGSAAMAPNNPAREQQHEDKDETRADEKGKRSGELNKG